ncbi:hypothetical protein [Soonwooa sp.]|uniref:hypothetical protein n=1 Tax=Soonwooa sp. TaxID=1938592 RepID=UPI002602A946|nr:hypothetical protein [Soonwooa sp.]
MKWIKFFRLSIAAGFLAISCTTGSVYTNNDRVYRAPDGGSYRTGEIYRDRNGSVYQNGRIIVIDRNSNDYRNLPPGQAKKIYGDKSAKRYAPGQQKKGYRYDQGDQDEGNGRHHKNKKYKNRGDNDDQD